jgi:hypothetical protein
LNTTVLSDTLPEDVAAARLLKISPVRRNIQFQESNSFVPAEEVNNTEEKQTNQTRK